MYTSCACSMCPCKNKNNVDFSGLCTCCSLDIHAKWTKKWMKGKGITYHD